MTISEGYDYKLQVLWYGYPAVPALPLVLAVTTKPEVGYAWLLPSIQVPPNLIGNGGSRLFFRGTHKVRDELQLSHFVG